METKLLQEINGLSKLNEKFEDYTDEQLLQEILAQYKNLEHYKPSSVEDLKNTAGGVIGSANDLVQAVRQLARRQ